MALYNINKVLRKIILFSPSIVSKWSPFKTFNPKNKSKPIIIIKIIQNIFSEN